MNPRTRKTLRISTLFALIVALLATTRFAVTQPHSTSNKASASN